MSSKQLWTIISGLVLCNIITILFFLVKPIPSLRAMDLKKSDKVAAVGNVNIDRSQWTKELESRFGKEVLEDMINQQVIFQAAKKYHISISDKEINRKVELARTTEGVNRNESESSLKTSIKADLLLAELITKDVSVSEEEMKQYYSQHESSFDIPASYHLAHIVTADQKESDQVLAELKAGSPFSTLAREKSQDELTAGQGGDLGFVSKDTDTIPSSYLEAAGEMQPKSWSGSIPIENGYAVLYLKEKKPGTKLSFEDVKKEVRRQIALEKMKTSPSPEMFWREFKVDWLYGPKK
ncbi:peptidyl-prolyl cis-trans isomerase [Peribacillus kribbensis]|uniref:peptidyl-prolyl cis-trans isomerase n=1 Tax=Peribacillus kribbensis TaxID=356658 RepID=UPI00047A20DB|nr:peptidyl-prolyl cis-trans isomerase [Peribacillus kribbensis]